VIYKGILGKKSEFFGAKCGQPTTILGHPVFPRAQFDSVFPVAFYLFTPQCSYAWNGKILKRRSGSLPLKSLNSPRSPSLLFQSFAHLLFCNGSLQYFVHYCCREDDPTFERDITRQGHIMCASHINRLGEGLRCCEGGHWRSRCAINDDGRPAGQVP
jgi:hypothetical protein